MSSQWRHLYRGDHLHSVIDTAEIIFAVTGHRGNYIHGVMEIQCLSNVSENMKPYAKWL
jgi:hypothetical protein